MNTLSYHIVVRTPVGIRIGDISFDFYERLSKKEIPFPSGEPMTYSFGIRNFYVAGPEGNLIEIGSMNKNI